MHVFVYKSLKKNGYYVYLLEQDNFESIPANLLTALGNLEFALEFELTETRKLATENPEKVMSNLEELGYHLQITDPLAPLHIVDKAPIAKS